MSIGFKYAWRGLWHMLRTEGNARIHCVATFGAVTVSTILGISPIEWVAIVLCIGMVLSAEAINTAVERICNHVSPEYNRMIGQAKDVAAGAVLVLAIASVVVAAIIFVPYIINLFD